MEQTQQINFKLYVLSTFKKDTRVLNINSRYFNKLEHYKSFRTESIVGTLDLIKFSELKELDCSNNKINQLVNIPFIIKLICSFNQIKSLDNLPNTLEYLDCSSNNQINLDNLPSSLVFLNCNKCFIQGLDSLPYNLNSLYSDSNISNTYPEKLTILHCDSIQENCMIPDSLEVIYDSKANNIKNDYINNNFKRINKFMYRRIK